MLPEWPPGTVAILATRGPHAIPVSTALRAGPNCVLLALAPSRGSLMRLRVDTRVALTVLSATDKAFTARGRARVVADPLPGAETVVAVAIDVTEVSDHFRDTYTIEGGVQWRWTDAEAERRDAAVREALQALAGTLPPP